MNEFGEPEGTTSNLMAQKSQLERVSLQHWGKGAKN